jgi:hypothetical protein
MADPEGRRVVLPSRVHFFLWLVRGPTSRFGPLLSGRRGGFATSF